MMEDMKEMEQGVLLQGLERLIASNTESIKSLFYNVKNVSIPLRMIPIPLPQDQQS